MSVQAMSWVIENSIHKSGDLVVLLMIANHARSDGGGSWPSIETLARESRMQRRQVQRCVRRLELSGELVTTRGGGPGGANMYSLPMVGSVNLTRGEGVIRAHRGRHFVPKGVSYAPPEPSLKQPSMKQPSERTIQLRKLRAQREHEDFVKKHTHSQD
jgi:hypothetical protein